MTDDTAVGIEAAFRKIDILPENEWHLPSIVQTIAFIPRSERGTPRREFRNTGRKASRKELDEVAEAARILKVLLEGLSQTSIVALADAGLLQTVHHRTLSSYLGHLETSARNADVSLAPEMQGRGQPPNNLASGVANILANNYWSLTGQLPTLSTPSISSTGHKKYGPFLDLVTKVFEILQIEAKPESFARRAAQAFKERIDRQNSV